MDNAVVKLML